MVTLAMDEDATETRAGEVSATHPGAAMRANR